MLFDIHRSHFVDCSHRFREFFKNLIENLMLSVYIKMSLNFWQLHLRVYGGYFKLCKICIMANRLYFRELNKKGCKTATNIFSDQNDIQTNSVFFCNNLGDRILKKYARFWLCLTIRCVFIWIIFVCLPFKNCSIRQPTYFLFTLHMVFGG